jgi:soluble lytic murein transglycosylase-like protein
MGSRPATARDRTGLAIVVALLVASGAAQAQPCDAKVPSRQSPLPAGSEKFKLIAQHCPVLVVPTTAHRAAQLDLYDGAAPKSVTVPMPEEAATPAQPAVPPSPPAPLVPTTPPDRNATRVISLAPAVTDAARTHGLDPLLLHAVAHVESRHNPAAVSHAGARGVMQVMPATGRRFGVGDADKLHDATANVNAGAAYLRVLQQRFAGDHKLMLAAYNAGEGAVEKHGRAIPPYPETQAYVRDVLAVYQRLSNEFSVSAQGAIVARGESR